MRCRHLLPSFRATCLGVGVTYVLLGASILVRGVRTSMTVYAVPETALASPHYVDAIFWVYVHTIVLGLVIALVGHLAESPRLKRAFARLMLGAHLVYLVLDVRTSDTVLGNALYEGPQSAIPALLVAVFTVLFLHASFCRPTTGAPSNKSEEAHRSVAT